MKYATRRHQTQKHISQEWKTFFNHCFPGKAVLPPNVLTSQKYDFIKSNVVRNQIQRIESSIERLVEKRLCLVRNPIPVPDIMTDRAKQPINGNGPEPCTCAIRVVNVFRNHRRGGPPIWKNLLRRRLEVKSYQV